MCICIFTSNFIKAGWVFVVAKVVFYHITETVNTMRLIKQFILVCIIYLIIHLYFMTNLINKRGDIQTVQLSQQIRLCPPLRGRALRWRHNGHDSVSNHQPDDCLLNRLFRRRSEKTSKPRVTGLCVWNSPGPVNSPHKWPVTRKMFPSDDVIVGDSGYEIFLIRFSRRSIFASAQVYVMSV